VVKDASTKAQGGPLVVDTNLPPGRMRTKHSALVEKTLIHKWAVKQNPWNTHPPVEKMLSQHFDKE